MQLKPQERHCFSICRSCYRCVYKGTSSCPSKNKCSGHIEQVGGHYWDPRDIDDMCRCTEGVIQIRLKRGDLIRRRMLSNPFKAHVVTDAETQDDRDWSAYVAEQRELKNDPTWDGLMFSDGSRGVTDWMNKARKGLV